MDEHYAVFSICWVSLLPFVAFQSLLSARDDTQIEGHHHATTPTATETIAPLLIVLGWICVAACVVSYGFRTSYEEARQQSLTNSAGLRVILGF